MSDMKKIRVQTRYSDGVVTVEELEPIKKVKLHEIMSKADIDALVEAKRKLKK